MKLFAFWSYDQFPYVLGGEITDMNSYGEVQTVQYGPGQWFVPSKIVPVAVGQVMLAQLQQLRIEYDDAKDKLHAEYLAKSKTILNNT